MTKELADDLRKAALEIAAAGHAGWGNACTAGADAIEALQARVVELDRSETQLIQERDEREEVINALCDAVLGTDRYEWSSMYSFEDAVEEVAVKTAVLDKEVSELYALRKERDALAAELAAARAQEPVSYRYKFTHPISGEPVWRDSSLMWNGQCVQEVQPLFAAPVPPVREPLSDNTIAALRQAIAQPVHNEWKEAVLEQLVAHSMGAPTTESPTAVLARLINMAVIMATDPAIGGSQPAQVPAWQPIETAPEDGSVFLVGNIGAGKQLHWTRAAVRGRMPLAKVFYTPLGESINAPTHWALLPAAPEVKS